MFKNFEIIGFGISVLLMAVAIYLIRVDVANFGTTEPDASQVAAAVVTVDNGADDQVAATENALYEAVDNRGTVERLVIDDVVVGTGDEVAEGDTVVVNYIGRLQNGTEFDNSYKRGEAFTFKVGAGRVIQGWDIGVVGMQVGGQRILVVPPVLAYGSGAVGPIPPNSTLVFAIELLEIQ